MSQLRNHSWPGNVRELENTLEKAVLFAKDSEIAEIQLTKRVDEGTEQTWMAIRNKALDRLERDYLEQALKRAEGRVAKVAEWMNLTPRAVYQKLKGFGMDAAKFRP